MPEPDPVDLLLERRFLPGSGAVQEVRAADEADQSVGFTGLPILYGERTAIGNPLRWGFYEEIEAGAAAEVLAAGVDCRFLLNHDPRQLCARTTSGTLRLAETDQGVTADADLAPVSYVRDVAVLLERRDITGMSFAFRVAEDRWSTVEVQTTDGQTVSCDLRTIVRFSDLPDVSIVTYPAYDATSAGLRSAGTADALGRHRGLDDAGVLALRAGREPAGSDSRGDAGRLAVYERQHRALSTLRGRRP
jgi:HK97 family phage prohead protease